MKKLLFILITTLSFNLFANMQKINLPTFKTLDTKQMQEKIKEGIVIIDIRRVDEWDAFGVIEGSKKLTFFDKNGKYDAEKWLKDLKKYVKDENTPFVLVCAHANRTKTVGKFLAAKTNYKHIFELQGGIKLGWINQGLATTKIPAKDNTPWYQFW